MSQYKIGEFSKRSSVSIDTLRFYEKMHLLHPRHQPDNHYRWYSDYDLLDLMQVRLMRSMEIPIAALQSNAGSNLNELYASVTAQADFLEQQIAELTAKLDRFKRIQRELDECKHQIGTCKRVRFPLMYCLYYDQPTTDAHTQNLIAQWCSNISYVHLTFHLPQAQFSLPPEQPMTAVMGIGILADYAAHCGIEPVPPIVVSETGSGIRALLCISDPLHPRREELEPVFTYLRDTNQKSKGDWHYRLRFLEHQPDGSMRCYIAVRVYTEPSERT